jgi:hypothetical protein
LGLLFFYLGRFYTRSGHFLQWVFLFNILGVVFLSSELILLPCAFLYTQGAFLFQWVSIIQWAIYFSVGSALPWVFSSFYCGQSCFWVFLLFAMGFGLPGLLPSLFVFPYNPDFVLTFFCGGSTFCLGRSFHSLPVYLNGCVFCPFCLFLNFLGNNFCIFVPIATVYI